MLVTHCLIYTISVSSYGPGGGGVAKPLDRRYTGIGLLGNQVNTPFKMKNELLFLDEKNCEFELNGGSLSTDFFLVPCVSIFGGGSLLPLCAPFCLLSFQSAPPL